MRANANYKLICFVFSMSYGYYTGLGAMISVVMTPLGYTSKQASIMGVCFLLSGILGAFIVSKIIDRTKKFLIILKTVVLLMLFFVAMTLYTLPSKNFTLLALNGCLAGFFTLPIIPVAFQLSVELSHPVSEALSNGLMMLFSQVFGIFVTYLGTYLAKQNPENCVYLFVC